MYQEYLGLCVRNKNVRCFDYLDACNTCMYDGAKKESLEYKDNCFVCEGGNCKWKGRNRKVD